MAQGTQATPSSPAINLIGFLEGTLERLQAVEHTLDNSHDKLYGNLQEIGKDASEPRTAAAYMREINETLVRIEQTSIALHESLGQSNRLQQANNKAIAGR